MGPHWGAAAISFLTLSQRGPIAPSTWAWVLSHQNCAPPRRLHPANPPHQPRPQPPAAAHRSTTYSSGLSPYARPSRKTRTPPALAGHRPLPPPPHGRWQVALRLPSWRRRRGLREGTALRAAAVQWLRAASAGRCGVLQWPSRRSVCRMPTCVPRCGAVSCAEVSAVRTRTG